MELEQNSGRISPAPQAPRGHQDGGRDDVSAAIPVLGDVAAARVAARVAHEEYRRVLLAAVAELERAGAADPFARVAESAGVSRQSVRELVNRARR